MSIIYSLLLSSSWRSMTIPSLRGQRQVTMPRELHKAIYEGCPIDIICIGTPDIVGDSVGPLIGTLLCRFDYDVDVEVIGTLRNPVVRSNYNEQLKLLRPGAYVIAIDAALGDSVGNYSVDVGPLLPGLGILEGAPPVGNMSIKCYTASVIHGVFIEDERVIYHLAYKIVRELTDLLTLQK